MKPLLKSRPRPTLFQAMAIAAGMIFVAFAIVFVVNKVITTTISTPKELKYTHLYEYFSGKTKPTKTLILFANNAEQRFGGGFLGSYAILRGNNGKFSLSDVNNIYNIDYDTVNAKLGIPVPEYMKYLAPYLSLRDSGLVHNWPTNAQEAMKFYTADTGDNVDAVIEVTPQVLRELLKQTGPVTLKDYNLTITDENFLEKVQLEVEAGKDKIAGKDPKAGILTGLAQVLMQRLAAQQNIQSLTHYSDLFAKLGSEKHILLYSSDPTVQAQIEELGLAGSIKKTDYNYFQLTEANFGADKSSPFIDQQVNYDQTILADGTSSVSLEISRRHTKPQSFPYTNPYTNKPDWLIKSNISYIQVLVPLDSRLKSFSGVDKLTTSYEKPIQQFNYISVLGPLGPPQVVHINYSIPQHFDMSKTVTANILIQKQTGGWPYNLVYRLHTPAGYHLVASSDNRTVSLDANTSELHAIINSDTIISFVYEKD
ncbi:MAG: DUF4012 domain-containing protein [Candidatus Saccharibacteria bacterium]